MTSTTAGRDPTPRSATVPTATRMKTEPAFQAFWLMRIGFCLVPNFRRG